MAKCKDCLHYEACSAFSKIINAACDVEQGCEHFKDRSNYQEVVRCKDCQYAIPYDKTDRKTGYYCQHPKCTFRYGTNWERLYTPIKEEDDFCSYGERREGE